MAAPVFGFRQSGLVDPAGRPLDHQDERARLLVAGLAAASDMALRELARHSEDVYERVRRRSLTSAGPR